MTSNTLRLTVPQRQGGNEPAYHFGARCLTGLLRPHDGPEEMIDVPEPDGESPENEDGIIGRTALLEQARATRSIINPHNLERIVALGGGCLIDLAPIAYLNEKHDRELGILWVDSHPDVMGLEQSAWGHAMVLGALLGEGDPDLTIEVDTLVGLDRVMHAGLNEWSDVEDEIISDLGLQHASAAEVADDSQPILD